MISLCDRKCPAKIGKIFHYNLKPSTLPERFECILHNYEHLHPQMRLLCHLRHEPVEAIVRVFAIVYHLVLYVVVRGCFDGGPLFGGFGVLRGPGRVGVSFGVIDTDLTITGNILPGQLIGAWIQGEHVCLHADPA